MKHILFVCTGNSCRSVMAEGMFRKMVADRPDDFSIISAGISAIEGFPATEETVNALREEGVDVSDHRSQRLTHEMIQTADWIFVMERLHKEAVLRMAPGAKDKISLLTDFVPEGGHKDIPDPIRMSAHFYKNVLTTISDCLKKIMEVL